jgi:hypothetical protein
VIARYLIGRGQHPPAELLFFRTSLAAAILAAWVVGRPQAEGDWQTSDSSARRDWPPSC